jgi:hypothetical protein
MRAYILTLNNMFLPEDYSENKPVQAAFLEKDEALIQLIFRFDELEQDFESYNHFDKADDARISVTLDVVEITDDKFNEINSAKRTGTFFISYKPMD